MKIHVLHFETVRLGRSQVAAHQVLVTHWSFSPTFCNCKEYNYTIHNIIILYCMAMRGIPEYIAQARTILHASVGQVQYGPSAGNIFWYPPNIRPKKIKIYVALTRPKFENWVGRSGFFFFFFLRTVRELSFQIFFLSL